MEDLAITKINVLGGYVSLGGKVLPAPNAIKSMPARPESLESLYEDFYPGLVIFDAHDPMPEWLRTCMEMRSLSVNRNVALLLITKAMLKSKPGNCIPMNKLVYLIDKDERCITMACVYDDWGIIYTIQL